MKNLLLLVAFIFLFLNAAAQEEGVAEKPFIGVYLEEVDEEKAEKIGCENIYGSYIVGIVPASPAEKAGVKTLDYIIGIDEFRVGEEQTLEGIMKKYHPGDKVDIHLFRSGKKLTLSMVLGVKTSVHELSGHEKERRVFFGVMHEEDEENGLKIKVLENSSADQIGIKDGDVISELNGLRLTDWRDLGVVLDQLEPGNKIEVIVFQDGEKVKLKGPIGSYEEYKQIMPDGDIIIKEEDGQYIVESNREKGVDHVHFHNINISNVDAQTVGLDGNSLAVRDLSIKLNEAKNGLSLMFTAPENGDLFIQLRSENNRSLYTYEVVGYSGKFTDQIPIKESGSYYLLIQQKDKSLVKQVEIE